MIGMRNMEIILKKTTPMRITMLRRK